jgi:hypothetical protein
MLAVRSSVTRLYFVRRSIHTGLPKVMTMKKKTARNAIAMYRNFEKGPLRRCCLIQTGLFPVTSSGGEPILGPS